MSTIHHDGGVIEIPFPEEKYVAYITSLSLQNDENLSVEILEKLFVTIFSDFKKGALSLDELSEIAGALWGSQLDKEPEVVDALYCLAELNFYVRTITANQPGNFEGFMIQAATLYEALKEKYATVEDTK